MQSMAIYPGTFDPMTHGHVDIIERGIKLFDKVIVAVAPTDRKNPYLSIDERLKLLKAVLESMPQVDVLVLQGLVVDFAKKQGASVILRGLRMVSDFDYEFQLAYMNHRLSSAIETVFLPSSAQYSHISGTIVREIINLGGDVSSFVPKRVADYLQKKRQL